MKLFAMVFAAVFAASPVAEAKPFKKHSIVGAWIYQSAYTELPNGTRINQFGEHPKGIFIILANGRYSHIVLSDSLPQVKSGILKETAPDEREALAEGVLAHFGTWTMDETAGALTVQIQSSSFPNFDGVTQTRKILVLDRDTLSYVNTLTSSGAGAKVVAVLTRVRERK